MHKVGLLVLPLIMISVVCMAQGIHFKHVGLEEAMQEAKEQDKLIFIDFYTDWCGPCKALAKGAFMDEKLGVFYNKNFINLKLDAEKEGKEAAKKYNVDSYPTLIFVNKHGKKVYKVSGSRSVEALIRSGEEAIHSAYGELSLESLQQQFPSKQKDEAFLKLYYQKMMEYGASPVEGIEAWLKVQTEIEEDDVDMMEFLMEHRKYLLVGGKAEAILKNNYNEYWDIATRREETSLENMKYTLADNTRRYAYENKSPEWMRTFITAWVQLPQKKNMFGGNMKDGNHTEYELDYLILAKDYDAFKSMAANYLDSVVSAKSLEQIRTEDKAYYEDYKKNRYTPSMIGDATLEDLEKGKEAGAQTRAIQKVGTYYLRYCDTRKEFKHLHAWIDYGTKLIPDDFRMDNLKADTFYKQGKTKNAIACKESALAKLSKYSRYRSFLTKELEKMKNGESL